MKNGIGGDDISEKSNGAAFQPPRPMIAPAADGCKRRLGSQMFS